MDTIAPLWLWIFFVASVLAALFVDFVVLKKQGAHEVGDHRLLGPKPGHGIARELMAKTALLCCPAFCGPVPYGAGVS